MNKAKIRILAIDDNESCLTTIAIMLSSAEIELATMSDPLEALQHVRKNSREIDLILLDYMMPEMDGFEFLRALQEDEQLKNIPVIIQTGVADLTNSSIASIKGLSAYLSKPFSKDLLFDTIKEVLGLPSLN